MTADEHEIFNELYARHRAALLGYCLRRVGRDAAPDIVSETFTVAWRRREAMPEGELVLPWLYAVAAKTIANHRRSLRRRSSLRDKIRRTASDLGPTPEVQVVQRSEDAAVIEAVQRLRPGDRELLLLSAWEGLTARQLAARYDITVAAAEKRLTRAKHRLAATLAHREKRLEVTPRVIKEGGM